MKRRHPGLSSAAVDTAQFHSYACFCEKHLSVDDQVYRAARVEAAKRNRSSSGGVRAYLQAFAQGKAPCWTRAAMTRTARIVRSW